MRRPATRAKAVIPAWPKPPTAVAALIEINEDVSNNANSNRSIEFHKFNQPWILNGAVEP